MQKKRVLFFPDRFSGEHSGPISARATLKLLLELGHTVALFTVDADKIIDYKGFENVIFYKINSLMRANSHFLEPKLEIQFKKILDDFMPEYYFMAGSIQKPSRLAEIARSEGVKNIFLF